MANYITPDQFDLSKLNINPKVRIGANNNKTVYVNYDGFGRPLVIKTGPLFCPFGVSAFTDESTGTVKYTLSASLRNPETDKGMADLKSMLSAIDQTAIKVAFDNSLPFFKKNHPTEVVKAIYKPCIRPAMAKGMPTEEFAPTFRMTLPFREGSFGDLEVYDNNLKQMDMMELVANTASTKNCTVRCVVQCTSMWITGSTGFGFTWKILQMKFEQPVNTAGGLRSIKGCCFSNTDGDDAQEEEAAPAKTRAKAAPTTSYVSDSDDEEDAPVAAAPAKDVPAAAPAKAVPAAAASDDDEEEATPVAAPTKAAAVAAPAYVSDEDEEEEVAAPVAAPAKAPKTKAPAPAPAPAHVEDDEEDEPVMTRTFAKPPARKVAKK